jgi:hypothetical protein
MNVQVRLLLLIIIITCLPIHLGSYPQLSQGILFENGTCINENLTNSSNYTINTNGTVGDFLKSLPSDNTILAELVCSDTLNETIVK